jgi:hypothetical protein
MKTVKSISLGLPTPFRIVEHIDMQACGEIRHSRLPACSGIPWDFIVAYALDARADGDVVEFRFQATSGQPKKCADQRGRAAVI